MKTLLDEEKIEETIRQIPQTSFTVLDFADVFQELYPEDWQRLVTQFGQFGEKRRYTVTTYLANRLDFYSQKAHSVIQPFRRYSQARFQDYRRPTPEERQRFGSPWIAVFRKKEGMS